MTFPPAAIPTRSRPRGIRRSKNQLLTVGAAAQTVNVALTASDAWEGDSVVPTKVGDVYQITSGAELKGFADLVNGGRTGREGHSDEEHHPQRAGGLCAEVDTDGRFQRRRLHRRL